MEQIILKIEINTNASLSEIHNAINIGLNDSFPDNGITDVNIYTEIIEFNEI